MTIIMDNSQIHRKNVIR